MSVRTKLTAAATHAQSEFRSAAGMRLGNPRAGRGISYVPLLAAITLTGGAFAAGWAARGLYVDAQETRTARAITERVRQSARASAAADVALATQVADIHSDDRETNDELTRYLDSRADLRAVDLGAGWLCIADRAAGVASPRCAGFRADAVLTANNAGGYDAAGDAASVPGATGAVPDMPREAPDLDRPD